MSDKFFDLTWEIDRKRSELDKLEKELRDMQKNSIFDNLKDGHYYSISFDKSYSPTSTTYYFKFKDNNVRIENSLGTYLDIDGCCLEEYSYTKKTALLSSHSTHVEDYYLKDGLHVYISDNEPQLKVLSDNEVKEIKKIIRTRLNKF